MLLEFTFRNFACFRNECTFSMSGTEERQHSERLARLRGFRVSYPGLD